jgi:FtsZ-binding cell division protein ZapB
VTMATTTLHTVETLQTRIGELAAQRQTLRAERAERETLERNRLEIARAQWQLSHALIERYLPRAA